MTVCEPWRALEIGTVAVSLLTVAAVPGYTLAVMPRVFVKPLTRLTVIMASVLIIGAAVILLVAYNLPPEPIPLGMHGYRCPGPDGNAVQAGVPYGLAACLALLATGALRVVRTRLPVPR